MPMPDLRHIQHPGPVAQERTTVVAGTAQLLHFRLEPGHAVDVAIANRTRGSGLYRRLRDVAGRDMRSLQVRHAGRIAGRPSCRLVQRHLCA